MLTNDNISDIVLDDIIIYLKWTKWTFLGSVNWWSFSHNTSSSKPCWCRTVWRSKCLDVTKIFSYLLWRSSDSSSATSVIVVIWGDLGGWGDIDWRDNSGDLSRVLVCGGSPMTWVVLLGEAVGEFDSPIVTFLKVLIIWNNKIKTNYYYILPENFPPS